MAKTKKTNSKEGLKGFFGKVTHRRGRDLGDDGWNFRDGRPVGSDNYGV